MKKERGYYVEYSTPTGRRQKAMVRHDEQAQAFKRVKRLFVHLLNDDLSKKMNDKQIAEVSLVEAKKCVVIGYFD